MPRKPMGDGLVRFLIHLREDQYEYLRPRAFDQRTSTSAELGDMVDVGITASAASATGSGSTVQQTRGARSHD